MKKRLVVLLLAALLVTTLISPALATETSESHMDYVFDFAEILSYDDWLELEDRAEDISFKYNCGVYIITLDDYTDYRSSVTSATAYLYDYLELGYGSDNSGIVLLLSMAERDYDIYVFGYGETAFTDYGRDKLTAVFLDNFRSNDWHGGFSDYLETCDSYLAQAKTGKPVDGLSTFDIVLRIVCIGVLPLAVAGIVIGVLRKQMKSVKIAAAAGSYIPEGGVDLTDQEDLYTHTTVTRVRIERNNTRGGGGGSSGGSHTSGKF